VSDEKRLLVEQAAQTVLDIRQVYSDKTLAALYTDKTMPDTLQDAHTILDQVVESCYRDEPFLTDQDRVVYLSDRYRTLTRHDV
jgi:hypothetical protein